jgi:hypothetical protein
VEEPKQSTFNAASPHSNLVSRVSSSPLLESAPRQETAPPWRLHGEAVVLLRDWRRGLALVKYFDSPVGPYLEHAEVTLQRGSKYFGPHVTRMEVSSTHSMREGRRIWGFPKTMQLIAWRRRGAHLEVESDAVWRFRLASWKFPVALAGWTWQNRDGEEVKVPCHLSGTARLAWRGRQWALFVDNFTLDVLAPI